MTAFTKETFPLKEMQVVVEKITGIDLMREACEFTINAESTMTLQKIYRAEHSPLRTQLFVVKMRNIPSFVSVHFVRHKVGVEHYVRSNREDRASNSGDEGRWAQTNHMMVINAQAMINMARKRLCSKAHKITIAVMSMVRDGVYEIDPDLGNFMVHDCIYRGRCVELRTCGFAKTDEAQALMADTYYIRGEGKR